MKKQIIEFAKNSITEIRFRGRYAEGKSDLEKGLAQSSPIDENQKNEILAFWKPYLFNKPAKKSFDIRWFDIYNRTNVFDFNLKYYIPDGYYYRMVDAFFSDPGKAPVLDDKNLYDLYFGDAPQPKTICRKIGEVYLDAGYRLISEESALNLCMNQGEVIVKASINSMAGSGVTSWSSERSSQGELKQILSGLKQAVVQEKVEQHKLLAAFCDSCVNTLRLVTLLFEGEVHLVTAVVIMGGKNAKTNHLHRGGIVCGILPTGQLRDTAFDGKLNMYKEHPNGIVFSDVSIPNFDECVSLVKELAPRLSGNSRLIGWDLTIDKNGRPVIIEANLFYGGSVQIAGGPVFGDLTPRVLDYIKKNF